MQQLKPGIIDHEGKLYVGRYGADLTVITPSSTRHREQRRHRLDPVPQVLQPEKLTVTLTILMRP